MSPVADLTAEDRDKITRYLSNPLDFPQEFKDWLTDWIGQNLPPIPIDQLQGYTKTRGDSSFVAASAGITVNSYTDLGGPLISGLPAGEYLAIFGCRASMGSSGGGQVNMNLGINGIMPTNESGAAWCAMGADVSAGCVRARRIVLPAQGSSVGCFYRRTNVGGSPSSTTVGQRFLVLIRSK